MVMSCCACRQRYGKDSAISFHSFPKDTEMHKKWIDKVRRGENFNPTKYQKVCSRHFTPESFHIIPWSDRKTLKPEAVPTIFHDLSDVKSLKRCRDLEIISQERLSSDSEPSITSTNNDRKVLIKNPPKRFRYLGDFKEETQNSPYFAYKQIVNNILKKKNHQIKILKQRERRLQKRVKTLEDLVKHMKGNNVFCDEASIIIEVVSD